jgi:hypothetical protein
MRRLHATAAPRQWREPVGSFSRAAFQVPELAGPGRASLRRLCSDHFDMQIEDVRVLLRMPKAGYPAGCNFAALAVLFNMIAGVSVCFYDASPKALTNGDRGKRFKNVLIDFFPWPTGIAPKDGADVFYKFGRNPMAHALGLDVPDAPEIGINKGPLSERRILELEDAANLPASAPPALRQQGDDYEIGVAGLYWGFHRLLRTLFADKKQSNAAEGLAHHLYF